MHVRSLLLFAALAASTFVSLTPALAEEPFSYATTPGTLPKHVRPVAYRIDVVPDLAKLATADGKEDIGFTGKVEIDLDVLEPTDSLTLSAQALTFNAASVGGTPATVTLDAAAQTARLQLPSRLAAGRHLLTASYAGKVTSEPSGLYYMKYDTPQGERRMLSTQMQPGYARRMFPGWDEPLFKATFTLSAVLPAGFSAYSNMPIAREEPAGTDRKKVTFATTPAMSSYLVVLAAGELGRLQRTVNGIDLGIVAPQDRIETGRYALDTAARALSYLSDYFEVPYPLPKLDNIAVPGGIADSDAMENWGASTYVENVLLFDPAKSSQRTREEIFLFVAHETAHQWFGNLVTPAWWDNLWLNEGFATWMEHKVVDHFEPSWKSSVRGDASKESVMRADAVRTSHPVQQDVADSDAARTAFDTITYNKGSAFIRMLEAFLGEEKFRAGLRAFMRKHAYSSATTADLWIALTEASGTPVTQIAASFIEQPGIPLILLSARCQNDITEVTLRQERFSLNNPYVEKRSWQVPVVIGRPGDTSATQSVLVGDRPARVTFAGCGQPIKANLGNTGYYRVQYDDEAFALLAKSFGTLAAADRVNLLADTWGLVQAGRVDIGRYLDLTALLKDETELVVWQSVADTLGAVDLLFVGHKGRPAFHAYVRDMTRPLQQRLGWDAKPDDNAETLLLRALTIETMGAAGDPVVIAEARKRFDAFVKKPGSLNPELHSPVANVVGFAADRKSFDALLRLARAAQGSEEKQRYYFALASAADPALGERAIEIARTDKQFPSGKIADFINQVVLSSNAPDRLWAFVLKHEKKLLAGANDTERDRLLAYAARPSSNAQVAFQVRWAEGSRASKNAQFESDKSADFIELRASIKPRVVPAVDAWLKARKTR
jgi:aminopeptidase N